MSKDVPHKLDLAGMKLGDWFMGCPRCHTQFPVNAAGATRCVCGGRMLIYDIKHHNVAEVKAATFDAKLRAAVAEADRLGLTPL